MSTEYSLTVVGRGIAAHVSLFYLAQSLKLSPAPGLNSLLIIESPEVDSCSLNTTSHVGTINPRTGISPLGDLIKESYDSFCHFVLDHNPEGVYLGKMYKMHDHSDEVREDLQPESLVIPFSERSDELKGYEVDHHIIGPKQLMNWLEKQYSMIFSSLGINVEYKSTHILDLRWNDSSRHYQLISKNNSIPSRRVLLASGQELFKKWTAGHWNYPELDYRQGDYLVIENQDLGDQSFAIMIKKANLVYRHFSNTVLIGGTTNLPNDTGKEEVNHQQLKSFYSIFKEMYPNLPEYEQCLFRKGTRVRGFKRYPTCEELAPGLFTLVGLYKNGFTFPFILAPGLVEKILKNI